MAKTQTAIYMDFRKATEQVKELREIAGNLEKLVNQDMADCLTGIGNNWKGDNADAYIRKGNTVKQNIKDLAGDLRTAATAMEEIAAKTKKAEEQALETVKNKNN